jgi:hypothetical protein
MEVHRAAEERKRLHVKDYVEIGSTTEGIYWLGVPSSTTGVTALSLLSDLSRSDRAADRMRGQLAHRNITFCINWRLAFVAALAALRRRLLVSWLVIATLTEQKKKALPVPKLPQLM